MKPPERLHYETYRVNDHQEWVMRVGPAAAPALLFLPPLFEEMNRTRAFILSIMRNLAAHGFGCWLLDLPGTGESARRLEHCSWDAWHDAVAAGAAHVVQSSARLEAAVSIRGGCLFDHLVRSERIWRFAPVDGASLVRDLGRAGLLAAGGAAGYAPSADLLAAIEGATPSAQEAVRIVRLASDRKEADLKADGPALWRRSEPATSPDLARTLATDIAQWVGPCVAS